MSKLGRCKGTLYLLRHKIVNIRGLGCRCKYCGKSYIHLKKEADSKERERRGRLW